MGRLRCFGMLLEFDIPANFEANYVAVNQNGSIFLFREKPEIEPNLKYWQTQNLSHCVDFIWVLSSVDILWKELKYRIPIDLTPCYFEYVSGMDLDWLLGCKDLEAEIEDGLANIDFMTKEELSKMRLCRIIDNV